MTWPGDGQGYGGDAGHGQPGQGQPGHGQPGQGQPGQGGWQQPVPHDHTGNWQQPGGQNTGGFNQQAGYPSTSYGGLGVYSTPGNYPGAGPQPPNKNKTLAIVLSIAAVLVLGGAGTTIGWLYLDRSKPPAADSSPAPRTPVSATDPNSASRGNPSSSANGTAQQNPSLPAKISGWQVVSTQRGIAYDVPPSWQVLSADTVTGFADSSGKTIVSMKGAASYKDKYCQAHSGSSLAGSGVSGSTEVDPAKSATNAAQAWANAGYTTDNGTPPTVTLSQPEPVAASGVQGVHVTATVKLTPQTDCDPPAAVVHVVAFPSSNASGTVLFIVYAHQGRSDAATDQDLRLMISSIRANH